MKIFNRITLFFIMLFLMWAGTVRAHVFPDRSEPRVGATVTAASSRVRIWFDGALETSFSTLRVQNDDGRQVDRGDCHVDSSDAKLLTVSIPTLPPGTYRVIWSVVARDGHRTQGDYTFTIK